MNIRTLTKYFPIILGLLMLFGMTPLEAKIAKVADQNMDLIIHTWGGGGLFAIVFNAVSVLLYGSNGWNGLFMVALTIGGFSALIMSFIKGSFEAILTNWFFPALMICGIILGPRDTLYIKDHLASKSGSSMEQTVYQVDDVPYVMKLFCSIISQMSHKLTHGLESVTHQVDSSEYNWTGHIYAGDTLFQAGRVDLTNPYLKKNLHNYVYDCVFNDINMEDPWYTKDDLYKADDIIDFMEQEAGVWLSTRYIDNKGESKPMRCKKAIGEIKKEFSGSSLLDGKPTKRFADSLKTEIFGDLNGDAQKLMGLAQDSLKGQRELLQQAFAIDSVQNSLAPNTYATLKAEQMHRSQQGILGAMGAKSIVAMKNFFEALIYCLFPIILILAVATLGFRSLFNWLQFLIWINLWPPFFVVVNFLLNTTWDLRMAKVFGGSDVGLSIFSSHGLADLYSLMESIAAGALFSVPFLAFAIVKGGVGSMMQLAGTLNAPAQSAASQAASERVSGNYSAGNIQWQNENIGSTSMYQKNENPFLQQGGMSYKQGNMMTSMGDGSTIMQKGISNVGADVSVGEAYGSGLQKQYSESEQNLQSKTDGYNHSWQNTGTSGSSMMNALGADHSFSNLTSKSEQDSATELYQKSEQQLQDISNNYGVSRSSAIELAAKAGAGIPLKGVFDAGGSVSTSDGTSHNDGESFAERDSEFRSLNDNIQKLKQFTNQDTDQENLSNTQRASQEFGRNFQESVASTEQLSTAQSNHQSWQEMRDTFERGDSTFRQNLSNEFVDEMLVKYDDSSAVNRMLDNPQELQQNLKDFSTQKANKMVEVKLADDGEKPKIMKDSNEVVLQETSTMKNKGEDVRGIVGSQVKMEGEIGAQYDQLDEEYKAKDRTRDDDYANHINAQDQIDANRAEMQKTKLSEEHKQAVKREAQEYIGKTVAKNTGKSLGKFWDGQKQKAYGRSERLKQQLLEKEAKDD